MTWKLSFKWISRKVSAWQWSCHLIHESFEGVKENKMSEAKAHIVKAGYDPHFGARTVKRVIQKQVLNELSKALLAEKVDISQTVVMDIFDGKIVFRKAISEAEEVVG